MEDKNKISEISLNKKHYNTVKSSVKKLIKENGDIAPDIMKQIVVISDNALSDPELIYQFCNRIREEREKSNISQKEVSEEMNVNQAAISRYERLSENKISHHLRSVKSRRDYLAAFALNYGVSPIYLLGLQNNPKKLMLDKDMIEDDTSNSLIDPFSFMIVMKLYDPENLKVIENFAKICSTSATKKTSIKKMFKSIPFVNQYIDVERSNLTDEFYEEFNKFLSENSKSYKLIRSYVITFDNLRKSDEKMYNILANISINIREDLRYCISALLSAGGYIDGGENGKMHL